MKLHPILEILVKENLLTQSLAEKIQKESEVLEREVEDLVLERRIVNERKLLEIKSKIFSLPVKIFKKDEEIPKEVLKLIPENVAKNYQLVAFDKKEDKLFVALLHPEKPSVQEALRFLSQKLNLDIVIYLTSFSDLQRMWTGYEEFGSEIEKCLAEIRTERRKFQKPPRFINLEEAMGVAGEEAPIIKIVSILLRHGVRIGASDIHIEPLKTKMRVRYRVDGVLHTSLYLPLELILPIVLRVKILSNLKIDITRKPQDGRFSTIVDNKEIDYRVSTLPTAVGEKVAIRILDPTIGLRKVEDLGLRGRSEKVIQKAIKKPYGMILITGPTGCGKTTTLYALLQELDREKINIITLEDPIEYFIEGINQSQIKPEIGYTFASGLRQVLRQDPDVIMVGEIRDEETAALATHAALTGHLVFSTLHTNNALGVIPRLVDMKVPAYLLPSAISLMVAQRLVPRLCPFCREKVKASKEMEEIIKKEIDSLPPKTREKISFKPPYEIYHSPGCQKCNFKGIKGRIALFEVFEMTPQLAKIISSGINEEEIREEFKRQGNLTMRQDGVLRALEGTVSLESVIRETAEE